MSYPDLRDLRDQFAIPGRVTFSEGPGGLPIATLRSARSEATVALQGAHVKTFCPTGQEPVLFVSRRAVYAPGISIRGGIPVCWPWFANHPTNPSLPVHGFVHTQLWEVAGAAGWSDEETVLRLTLSDSPETRTLWPHAFQLELLINVGAALEVRLHIHNTGGTPFSYTGALHSYLQVGELAQTSVSGLEGCAYVDKVAGGAQQVLVGAQTFCAETDRVFLETESAVAVEDRALRRRIVVTKEGSRSTVVWNPWQEKAAQIPDFEAEEYRTMVCVEAANALSDSVTLEPFHSATLATRISIENYTNIATTSNHFTANQVHM